jgi:hypothetical protein
MRPPRAAQASMPARATAAHFNLCRVHEALRITPAMAIGVTDHIWMIGELIDAALYHLTVA